MPALRLRVLLAPLLIAIVSIAACGGGGGSGAASDSSSTSTTVSAPSITAQPASATVTAGASANFTVAASGGGTLSYQWYKGGTAIAGATSSTYTITTTTTSDAGSFYVVVSNSAGSATSSTVTLVVNPVVSGTGESWNLSTGANPNDLIENQTFGHRLAIALDSGAVTSTSGRLVVGTASGSVTPVTLDGTQVITITQDSFGTAIASDMPGSERVELALSGRYAGSVTIYSEEPYRLTLNGTEIASPDGPALNLQSGSRIFLVLADGTTNTLTDTATYTSRKLPSGDKMDLKAALFAEKALIISGGGSLAVTSQAKHAIASDNHVRLRSGSVTLLSRGKDGIRANNAFVMDGGTLSIETTSGAGKGIKVEGKEDTVQPLGFIALNAGALTVRSYDKAVTASWEGDEDGETTTTADDPDPLVTINGGTLNITTFGTPYEDRDLTDGDSSQAPEGIESKSTLTVNGGTLVVTTTDDGLNAGQGIVITGGRLYVRSSNNDAIDSNGFMTLSGGLIVAIGANGAEGGLDCDNNTFTVTGGTFIGIGGRNSIPTMSASTQNSVVLSNGAANTLLTIRDGSGNAAFAFQIPATSPAILLGAPAITTGRAYTVYTGGTVSGQNEIFNGLYVGSSMTHSGGTAGRQFTVSSRVTTP